MGGFHIGATVMAIALSAAAAQARAQAPASVWEGCGENKVSGVSKFMVGPTAARSLTPKASAEEGVSRCSAALNALDAMAPWQRRAALLRSRAKFYVMGKNPAAALADLDAIAAIEQPDMIYARSFGVSMRMLRAVAQLQAGRRDVAANEALEAMRLRPWSERVAQFAYAVCAMRDQMPTGEGARWNNLVALDGSFAELRAGLLARAGDWVGATADWLRASPGPGEIGQTYVDLPNVVVRGAPGFPLKVVNLHRTVEAAMTAAMAGRADLADAWLARLRTNIDAPTDDAAKRFGVLRDPAAQKAELATWAGLIEVAKLAGDGNSARAAALLDAMSTLPISGVSTAMMRSIAAKAGAPANANILKMLAKIDERTALDREGRIARLLESGALLGDLPDHEEVMLANPYRSAVKFLRANGSSVKLASDGKTAQVSFFGNKSQPFAIGEMTLLRAAELTLERQQKAFRIISSDGYVHTVTQTIYGASVGPTTVSGNSVALSIEFVDPATPGALDAAAISSALGPIYVKQTPGGKS